MELLIDHIGLRKLTLSGIQIGRRGCATLATLLKNPRSNLTALHLLGNPIDDQEASIVANGLARGNSLTIIEIGVYDIQEIGLRAIFSALQRSQCRFEKFGLSCKNMNATAALSLLSAMRRHHTTLKTLKLCNCPQSTAIAGWSALFQPLWCQNSALEKLILDNNCITNEDINALTDALGINSRLTELSIADSGVTATGLVAISRVLCNPNSALEKLCLGSNPINNQVMISFAEALVNNNLLKELIFGGDFTSFTTITSNGYAAFTHLLCNHSSSMNTYQSNHTLDKLCCGESVLREDLKLLLSINRENSEHQAAHIKIVKTHLSGCEINMQTFLDMDLSSSPHAIAWISRNCYLYQYLRAMPSLLEKVEKRSTKRSTKRSREW